MPDPSTMPRTGLFTTGKVKAPVPLAGVTIDADLHGFYAKVVIAQRYVNREAGPIEAVYLFPLDEGAAVCGFEAVVDGTLVIGEVHERDKAFEIYDDAMGAGHGAFLLDEERPDVFQASVGNLPPGKEVTVRLTYVTEQSIDDGRLRFAIPTTVSPRYAPAEDRIGTGRPDAEALNPPVAWSVPYGLNLSVRVSNPAGITLIESPSHPISVRMENAGATVSLAQADAALDRDFVLSIEAPGLDSPQALVEHQDDGTEAVGVAFAPRFAAASAAAEVIFLVDRSGSMEGASIAEVRNALQLCLRSLTSGCRFNIVGFGSRYNALFPESRPYEQSTLDTATAHVAALDADLGGTEIYEPLKNVLERKPAAELPRQVVILTDGQVTNTDAVIALAAAHAPTARIFTFGIGAGASHHLVRGLARAGGGSAEFIYPGERLEPKVLRLFGRLLSPALTDVRVEWEGGAVAQAPTTLPPVFAGGRLLVYGFVKQRPTAVHLTARGASGPLSFAVPLPDATGTSGRTVSTLAARARIRELEEGDWAAARGSRQTDRKVSGVRQEIIALGVRYGLMSRETSFVAVERRDMPVEGDVALRKVPIALTTGWGGSGRSVLPSARLALSNLDTSVGFGPVPQASAGNSTMFRRLRALVTDDGDAIAYSRVEAPAARSNPGRRDVVPPRMQALVMLQNADGSWAFTLELASILGRDFDELRGEVRQASGSEAVALRAWATALALAWLQINAADLREEWHLLGEKARRWLEATTAVPPGGVDWIEAARRALR